jgi:hypothetical protein
MNESTDYYTSGANTILSTLQHQEQQIIQVDTILLEGVQVLEDEVVETLESIGNNILDAALPQDATALLSITLGEGIAGVLGAVATWGVNLGLRYSDEVRLLNDQDNNVFGSGFGGFGGGGGTAAATETKDDLVDFVESEKLKNNYRASTSFLPNISGDSWLVNGYKPSANKRNNRNNQNKIQEEKLKSIGVDNLFNEAVADGDYFLTRAAASPLIGAFGMTGGLTSALTVLVATVPYELIKISAKAREQKVRENLYFDLLIEEEQRNQKNWFGNNWSKKGSDNNREETLTNNEPMEMGYQFDFVELFADVCKWLEYDVLNTDFGGKLRWPNSGMSIDGGIESASFGFLAALSSQIYADVIYSVSDSMGSKEKRDEVRTRTFDDYIRIYSVKCLSAATLFGVYESTRLPVTLVINNFLSGGYDSCLGSKDFDLCLETYFFYNPAEASPEAQLRSFFVALVNLTDRVGGDISNQNVDAAGLIRSLSVQLYSITHSM